MFGNLSELDLVPYQAMDSLPGRSLLVLAPHPDDEVFGCGGLLAMAARQGLRTRVLVLTDGAAAGSPSARAAESRRAAAQLGYADHAEALQFLGRPDRGLQPDAALLAELLQHAQQIEADLVLAPSPFEVHPDHRAACVAALDLCRQRHCSLAFYEIAQALMPNRLLDISALLPCKQRAMACFETQLREQPYDELVLALNRFRAFTLGPQVSHAEAFWLLEPGPLPRSVDGVLQQLHAEIAARLRPTPAAWERRPQLTDQEPRWT